MIQEHVKLVDVVIELVDARVPLSSTNLDLRNLYKDKKRLILLNKVDLADERFTKQWIEHLKDQDTLALGINARDGKGMKQVMPAVMEVCKERIDRNKKRGLINKPIRGMVVGIPNVGKSTFINKLVGKSSAKTGNKPGVTKGKQWIKFMKGFELMDTPGMLWPKFEDQEVGKRLAMVGSIREEIMDLENLAFEMVAFLKANYPKQFLEKYPIDNIEEKTVDVIFHEMTDIRNFLVQGGEPNYQKMAKVLYDEFKNGRIAKMTLDRDFDLLG